MVFLTIPAFVNYSFTEEQKQKHFEASRSHWEIERSEKSPVWNFLYGLTGGTDYDLEESIWWLQEFPLDLVSWNIDNSKRNDLEKIEPNFRHQTYKEVLPPDEQPVHEVCLRPFKLDKYEVSQGNFQAVIGDNPSRFKGANLPVDSFTWEEAFAYCKKFTRLLPTEAQSEYAARAGSSTAYYWRDDFDPAKSNYCDSECELNIRDPKNSDGFKYTAAVGSFPANPFGLHDMEGNVNEWVQDWMEDNYYRVSPKDNPTGPTRQSSLVHGGSNKKSIRGGSWGSRAEEIRPTNRKAFWINFRLESLGFRCAANP